MQKVCRDVKLQNHPNALKIFLASFPVCFGRNGNYFNDRPVAKVKEEEITCYSCDMRCYVYSRTATLHGCELQFFFETANLYTAI